MPGSTPIAHGVAGQTMKDNICSILDLHPMLREDQIFAELRRLKALDERVTQLETVLSETYGSSFEELIKR